MHFFSSNRKRSVVGAIATVLVIAAGAAAYWTAGGAGDGTATTGATEALVVNQVTVLEAMYPGDSPQTLSGTFDNGNDGLAYVTSVTASIASVMEADGTTVATGCDSDDFTLTDAVMSVGTEVPVGAGEGTWTGADIQFNNTAANQDACKDVIVNLHYVVA
jgi:hypothetical protein